MHKHKHRFVEQRSQDQKEKGKQRTKQIREADDQKLKKGDKNSTYISIKTIITVSTDFNCVHIMRRCDYLRSKEKIKREYILRSYRMLLCVET